MAVIQQSFATMIYYQERTCVGGGFKLTIKSNLYCIKGGSLVHSILVFDVFKTAGSVSLKPSGRVKISDSARASTCIHVYSPPWNYCENRPGVVTDARCRNKLRPIKAIGYALTIILSGTVLHIDRRVGRIGWLHEEMLQDHESNLHIFGASRLRKCQKVLSTLQSVFETAWGGV